VFPKANVITWQGGSSSLIHADWEKLYTAALQKKFLWVKNVNPKWKEIVS